MSIHLFRPKEPTQADPTYIKRLWRIVEEIRPEWLAKPSKKRALPSKHVWTPDACAIVVKVATETRLTRRHIAECLDGHLEGGMPLSIGAVTGILRRNETKDAPLIVHRAPVNAVDATALLDHVSPLYKPFYLRESDIKESLISPISELSTYMTSAKPDGISRYFLEHLEPDECQYPNGETADGITLHCACKCRRKENARGSIRKFMPYCPEHTKSVSRQIPSPMSEQKQMEYLRLANY